MWRGRWTVSLLPHQAVALLAIASLACLPVPSSACGGYTEVFSADFAANISSPNYPNGNYDRNTNCIWLFAANSYLELRVNVSFMRLETLSDGSCKDYVAIKEGSSTAAELATLCTPSSNTSYIVALNRYLWIQFRSDSQNQDAGFQLTITAANNSEVNSTSSPIKSCSITQYTCPNKECVDTSGLCDNFNDCGCSSYGCDETKCWKFELLESVGFNWGVGVGIGFFIGLVLLIAFGLYEMPQHRRPECMKRHRAGGAEGPESSCLLACSQRCRRNKVDQRKPGDQFKSMLEKMSANRHPLRWETESESSRGASRRTSVSGGPGSSRRSSYQLSATSYGNTLSPKDLPPKPGTSAAAAAAAPSPRSAAAAASTAGIGGAKRSPTTLAVPTATTSV